MVLTVHTGMICWCIHPILFKVRRKSKKAIVLSSSFVFLFYSARFSNPLKKNTNYSLRLHSLGVEVPVC